MKKIILLILFLFVFDGFARGQLSVTPSSSLMDTLYPPTELQVVYVETVVFVFWDKPVAPGGGVPAGLLGYYVYRNGLNVYYVDDPDEVFFYDFNIDPGLYVYKTTAYYDLTSYGHPGLYAESGFSNSYTFDHWSCYGLPIWEHWDMGTFAFLDWFFYPSKGNWDISTTTGNPLPTALFKANPELNDFDCSLTSPAIWSGVLCANYIVEFDLKMEPVVPGNSARLYFELYYDSTWYTKEVYDNINTDGWVHYKYDVSEGTGHFFRIRFRATGISSTHIESWMVDNILVNLYCLKPDTIGYVLNNNLVTLFWKEPCRKEDTIIQPNGYNVYRTDSTGNPPYIKLNTELITDTFYVDSIPQSLLKGKFRYSMNIFFDGCISDTSAPILVLPSIGMNEPENISVRIFPNPVSEQVQIQSELTLESITVWSTTGVVQFQIQNLNGQEITIPVDHLSEGIYWIGISTRNGYFVRKIIVMRR